MIRDGVDAELDDLRGISRATSSTSRDGGGRARANGHPSSKIRYNRVFGYYIEISKSNLGNVPADYHRKQTIAGGERYITPALKEYEEKVLGADERISSARSRFSRRCAPRLPPRRRASRTRHAAWRRSTCWRRSPRPPPSPTTRSRTMHDGDEIVAVDARHPVVERHVSGAFVPNDVTLDGADRQLVVLTGPNMGGKSTYLRQTALLCLLAQAGSFVPARSAKLPVVDRIFARVGASDNIARGQSTFMVEMQETAQHPAQRDVAQPRHPRRDRPRHGDVRRPEPRVGRRRTSRVEPDARGRRRSSRRTITS